MSQAHEPQQERSPEDAPRRHAPPGNELDVFVATAPGLEHIAASEIEALAKRLHFAGDPEGTSAAAPLPVPVFQLQDTEPGGVSLRTSPAGVERLNLQLRTGSHVLVRMGTFRARTFAELERKAARLAWSSFLPPGVSGRPRTAVVDVTSRKSRLYHTGAVEQRIRRVADLATPEDEPDAGALPLPRFVIRILRDQVTVSADSSGHPLHRRGYRLAVAKAPLRENLAAALVLASGWDGRSPLLDPFCGSGTIPIEAAMIAHGIPPGKGRRRACEGWEGWPPATGEPRRHGGPADAAPQPESDPYPLILGADRDAGAMTAAWENAGRAGVRDLITFQESTISDVPFPQEAGHLVSNPPWGERVGDVRSLRNLYQRLGDRLRENWPGARVTLLLPDRRLGAATGLRLEPVFRTSHGGITVEALHGQVPGGR